MSPESLKLITAANIEISGFLEQLSKLSSGQRGNNMALPEVQPQLAAIAVTIENVGRALGSSPLSELTDAESVGQANLYASNLEKLRGFLLNLLPSAKAHHDELKFNSQKVREALLWSNTLKLTSVDR